MENLNRIPRSTSFDYKYPPTVESIRQGWISSVQASIAISGLFTVLATIFNRNSDLIATAPSPDKKILALEMISYASIFLNVSACMSCFILIDRLADIPYRASPRDLDPTKGANVSLQQQSILKIYGIGTLWRGVVWHWLFCFTLGAWSIFAQIVLYIALVESKETKIVMASLAGFCSPPFIAFIFAPVVNLFIELVPFFQRTPTSLVPRNPTTDMESDPAARSPNSPTRPPLPQSVHHSPTQIRPSLTSKIQPAPQELASATIPTQLPLPQSVQHTPTQIRPSLTPKTQLAPDGLASPKSPTQLPLLQPVQHIRTQVQPPFFPKTQPAPQGLYRFPLTFTGATC